MPSVSVLIPVYNGADLLPRALRSVAIQTFRDFETIVLDDGSTDGTDSVVAQFPFARLVRQQNRGIGVARQRLIEEAKAEWVAFLDHDDEYEPEMLELLLGAADNDAVLVHGQKRIAKAGQPPETTDWQPHPDAQALDHLLIENRVSPSSTLLRRSALLADGFEPEIRKAEDWLAWFRLAGRGEFRFVDQVVATIHKREDSASRPDLAWYEAERHVLEDHVLRHFETWYVRLPRQSLTKFRSLADQKLGLIASLEGECLDKLGRREEARIRHREALQKAPTKGAYLRYFRHLVSWR